MPVEIWPFSPIESMQYSIPLKAVKKRLRPQCNLNQVPEGYDAKFEIGGIQYIVHDYRDRPGHTPGACIEGDGVRIELSPTSHINAINKTVFKWKR